MVKVDKERDIIHLEENFYIMFRYEDVPHEIEFLRSRRALRLQIKSDNVEEMTWKILVPLERKFDMLPGLLESISYLYSQAPPGG